MGESDRDLQKYGEPLIYDQSFKGPLSKRSCTDVLCLIIFLVFLGAWGFVAYYAISRGDLNKLLVPTDTQNNRCGLDNTVLDKPYLFFFDLQECINPIVPITGCPTPQVCVKECPTETFIFKRDKDRLSFKEVHKKLICITENDKAKLKNLNEIANAINLRLCAGWYVKSTPLFNRCIWDFSSTICEYDPKFLSKRDLTLMENKYNINNNNTTLINSKLIEYQQTNEKNYDQNNESDLQNYDQSISFNKLQVYDQKKTIEFNPLDCRNRELLGEQIIKEKTRRTGTYLARFIGNFVAHFDNGINSHKISQMIVEDITDSWQIIFLALILAMGVSLLFIAVMRWVAAPIVWFSIIGVLAMLGYGVYYTSTKYVELKNHPVRSAATTNLGSYLQSYLDKPDTWLVLAIILSVMLVIILLMVIFLRKRIVIAIALIKEGSKAVSTMISSVFFPIFPWLLHIAVIAFAIIIALYLASVGDSKYIVVGEIGADKNCICSGDAIKYQNGGNCDPKIFNQFCSAPSQRSVFSPTPFCTEAGCYFEKIAAPNIITYFHIYNIIGFFWLAFYVSAFGEMVLAGTFATWYWTFHKSDVPYFVLTGAFCRTLRYHMGTLAMGSLIITICRLIRVTLEFIETRLKKYDNAFTRAILCCMKCFFWCLENFLRFINKNAYIMCAIHGKNFCTSAKDAFNLLMRNFLRVITLDKVTDFLFFLSKILITLAVGCGVYFWSNELVKTGDLHYQAVPTVIVMIGTYLITTVFFGVYSMAVDTLFLCFLEDCERNDGSAEKPYFMSKQLMKILGRKNELPRHQYR